MLRDKLPAQEMFRSLFSPDRPMITIRSKTYATEYTIEQAREEGFQIKGANFKWKKKDEEKMANIILEISKNKEIVHTDPNKLAYWIRQHRLDREIPEESIEKMIHLIKKKKDADDAKK